MFEKSLKNALTKRYNWILERGQKYNVDEVKTALTNINNLLNGPGESVLGKMGVNSLKKRRDKLQAQLDNSGGGSFDEELMILKNYISFVDHSPDFNKPKIVKVRTPKTEKKVGGGRRGRPKKMA